jgi:phosphoglycolate phosphatase
MGGSGPVGFDLDMTLINSRPAILASFAETSRETGTAIDLDAVDRRLGVKLDDELAFWFPPDRVAAAAEIYRRHYLRLAEPMTTVLPGAHEALAAVRAAGQRAVIITAKHPVSARPSLQAAGLAPDELFTLVHGPEKAAVLRRLKAVAYVGDTPPDMAAAVQAGARAVGVATGSFTADDLAGAGAEVVLDSLAAFPAWYRSALGALPLGAGRDGRHDLVRQVPRVHEQRPGHLADPRPERGQRLLAVPPGGRLVAAEPGRYIAPEPARVAAVRPPGRQPRTQLVVAGRHRPVPQPLGDLARSVDDEHKVAAALDAMHPALGAGTVPDAGRAERGSDGQRGYRVAGFVPGCPHGRGPGRGVAGRGPEIVALPDPGLVHDGLVVVADEPGQFGLDPGQGPGLRGRHLGDSTQNSLPSGSASTVHGTPPWAP